MKQNNTVVKLQPRRRREASPGTKARRADNAMLMEFYHHLHDPRESCIDAQPNYLNGTPLSDLPLALGCLDAAIKLSPESREVYAARVSALALDILREWEPS